MKKTLSKKIIKGKEYFYLSFRKGKKVVSQYLGSSTSPKFKKYLLSLLNEGSSYQLKKAKTYFFKEGLPVVYVDEGYLVYEYKNGAKEYLNSSLEVVKVK